MMKAVLALDLGTNTGFAIRVKSGKVMYGTQVFKNDRFSGGGMRFVRFNKWVEDMIRMNDVHRIVFEEVRKHAGTDAAHAYGGFLAYLTGCCEALKVPYEGVPVGTIKRHATGKGNANKDQMIAAVKKLGYDPKDDNQADAIALLEYAISQEKTP